MVCHVVLCIKILKGEDLPAANLNYEENSFLRYKCSKLVMVLGHGFKIPEVYRYTTFHHNNTSSQ